MIRKAILGEVTKASSGELEFVLSDDTKDRMGDVINPQGWKLTNFKKNPIALFNHDSRFPIGTWSELRVEGTRLVGKLKLASLGTSHRIDEIIKLVQQDILRAVSVGFQPIDQEPLADNTGIFFKKQELLETSLVSVPANPKSVQLARSLNTSDEVIGLVFGEHAREYVTETRGANGEHADTPPLGKSKTMNLSQRIQAAQTGLTTLKDQLTDHLSKSGDEPDDTSSTITEELNGKIATAQRGLESLQAAEKALGMQAASEHQETGTSVAKRAPLWAAPAKKVLPKDYVLHSILAKLVGHATKRDPREVMIERYGEDGKIDEGHKAVFSVIARSEGLTPTDILRAVGVYKAATAIADTTTSGWASQLVETSVAQFMELLIPASVYPGLSSRGLRLSFGRSGIISIPSRSSTPTVGGSFVAQGAAIPVRAGAFGVQTLTPKKMAVISVFTREIAEHSTPAIEGLIQSAIQEDTSVALDTVLLDNTAADTTRPAGLRAGVGATTATAGGGFAALVGDVKALVGALITSSNGSLRSPVWIMNPVQAIAISLTQNAGGDFPFAAEIGAGRLQGYGVIQSSTVTAGMVILVDAGDFVSVEGDAPRFDTSDQATLHMDTAPTAISTVASPNTVAAPIRSLYQTDSIALRMLMDVNWAMRRTGMVAWTQSVTW